VSRKARPKSVPWKIDEMVRKIVERFDPERVILFGSHARGTAGRDSDVDLLVVLRVSGSKRQKQLELRLALRKFPAAKGYHRDSPEEFAWRHEIPGTSERPAALAVLARQKSVRICQLRRASPA